MAPDSDRPLSSSSSFCAMSDEEEGYDTITHSRSARGVKLLYCKNKVYVHPTPTAKDNIAGYIALLQQKNSATRPALPAESETSDDTDAKHAGPLSSDLLLGWLPDASLGDNESSYVKVDMMEGDGPSKQAYLVPPPPTVTNSSGTGGNTSFAVPLSAIYSLTIRPPSLGWWYGSVIINSRAGDSFPALFFHDNECQSTIQQKKRRTRESFEVFGANGEVFWGGDELLRWLKQYVRVERSGAEPNIYLIDPSEEDLKNFGKTMAAKRNASNKAAGAASPSANLQVDPLVKFVRETGWNIMERFSRVTTFTRRAAQEVLDNPRMPPQMRRLLQNRDVQTLQDEYDVARIYLARWAMGVAEQSEKDRSRRVWTAKDVLELEKTELGDFEILNDTGAMSLQDRRQPVTFEEWDSFFDPVTGSLSKTIDEVKERIFHGGLDPDDGVRKEAWPFLLGVYSWYSTTEERKAHLASLRDEYYKLKQLWWERLDGLGGESDAGEWWRDQRHRIEKDVHRTDRNIAMFSGDDIPHPDPKSPFAEVGTNVHLEQLKELLLTYNEYNKDLGYVQGMSDLLAPLYAVIQDDALAFWCFQHFMDRMERNFLKDQSGMRSQLLTLDHLVHFMDPKLYEHLKSLDSTNFFFFFRMLLVWYKREFQWDDVLHLWEVLWTDFITCSFHLFVALAIMEKHRDVMINHLKGFDEVLKYVNELSCTMDLDSTLIRAESLFRKFQRMVEAVDKKDNFPVATGSKNKKKVAEEEQIVTPELRKLLSRNVEVFYVPQSKRAALNK